jgi:hypothetical protein
VLEETGLQKLDPDEGEEDGDGEVDVARVHATRSRGSRCGHDGGCRHLCQWCPADVSPVPQLEPRAGVC